jgi:nucleoside-diphosphate-sugar epimerase
MHNEGIIVTGANGFLGKNLFEQNKNLNLLTIKRTDVSNSNQLKLYSRDAELIDAQDSQYSEFTLIHLATLFSVDLNTNNEIKDANLDYGQGVLKKIEHLNLKKIIYTNSMFGFYKDEGARSSYYSVTKNLFSEYLSRYTKDRSILFEEIYIDNNFGSNDKRSKVMPAIFKSFKNNYSNPIKNPEAFMNLLFIDDVVKRINYSLESDTSGESCFIDKKMIRVESIYKFIENYIVNKSVEPSLLDYQENDYISGYPEIDLKNIKLTPHEKSLITATNEVMA